MLLSGPLRIFQAFPGSVWRKRQPGSVSAPGFSLCQVLGIILSKNLIKWKYDTELSCLPVFRGKEQPMFVFVFNEQRQHWMEIYFPPTVVVVMPLNKEFCVSTLLWLVDGSMKPLTVPYTYMHKNTGACGHKSENYFGLCYTNNPC